MDTQDVVQVPAGVGVAPVQRREPGSRLDGWNVSYVGHVSFVAGESPGKCGYAILRARGNGLPAGEATYSFITEPSNGRRNLFTATLRLLFAVCCAAPCAGAGAVLVAVAPAAAQDEFGRMVAVSGGTVIVGKPGPARGPAALYRFERDRSGAWVLTGTVSPPGTAENGFKLAPTIRWRGERLVVGSADPDVRFGAYLFQNSRSGLVHETGLELLRPPDPGGAEKPGGPGGTAMATGPGTVGWATPPSPPPTRWKNPARRITRVRSGRPSRCSATNSG